MSGKPKIQNSATEQGTCDSAIHICVASRVNRTSGELNGDRFVAAGLRDALAVVGNLMSLVCFQCLSMYVLLMNMYPYFLTASMRYMFRCNSCSKLLRRFFLRWFRILTTRNAFFLPHLF